MLSRAIPAPRITHTGARFFSHSTRRSADFTHAVIGGGVVGLAVARQLQSRGDGSSTVLIERHGAVGTETSSRNSEVIHAGLYYGPTSLKARLCIRGRHLLYALCRAHSIPHHACGKWVVAQSPTQLSALDSMHSLSTTLGVPTRFLSAAEARSREPDVRATAGVLESPETGIVDSHALMAFLLGDFEEKGGVCAVGSDVVGVVPLDGGKGGWEVTTRSSYSDGTVEEGTVTAEVVVNSGGLAAIDISNMVMPEERRRKAFFAKGTYFSYAKGAPKPKVLVYPAPVPGHGGLGTHLTLDMGGRVRFGPDVEWTDDPTDYTVSAKNLEAALGEIETYLPGIDREAVGLDYVGIRPKLGRSGALAGAKGGGFLDFYIEKEEGFEGFVNLLGIESPGLTSSLAIAEEVERLLYK
ncbi:FAD dependent oxidoreductase [Aaosphaeria arxii CBS 175.79]|uniref:L-2-hydroxyglutarate dehydrogenase, mitochondrial n=1 Tax=Aaosphaeria arxii CBS 175.79 TaxID=1450172 RepID=A0A6A5XC09_9PLEO|nr:FAD dependent oxidoreductase [Aaosphaeria arxii CBS 175.79]KAF2010356.1 FAD dependent oxidoreductase [Aaosphaeria arxii CBS 175.79]